MSITDSPPFGYPLATIRDFHEDYTPWKVPSISVAQKDTLLDIYMTNGVFLFNAASATDLTQHVEIKVGDATCQDVDIATYFRHALARSMLLPDGLGLYPEWWPDLVALYDHECLRCRETDASVELCRDHVVPRRRCGRSNIFNIQPLCRPCNSCKGVRIVDYRPIWFVHRQRELEKLECAL